MQIQVDHEFLTLCEEILKEDHSLEEWREIESDDMFQSPHYEGGFDATEDAFCFSYYDSDGGELWFQLTISEMTQVVAGDLKSIEARRAGSRSD
jgi:hypothetical protein